MHRTHTSSFTRWSAAARRAVAEIGRVRSVRERRRRGLAALLALALVSQLVLGPLAEALPCETVMADCPHMTATPGDGHSTHTEAPGPDVPADCLMDLAGVCSGVHAPADATAVMSSASPVTPMLEAREPSLPPLEDPPFELLRPPKR